MKNIKIFTALLISLLIFTGCQKTSENKNINELTDINITSTNLKFTNIEYNFNFDSQNYFDVQSRKFAAIDTGYYFLKFDENALYWIYYFDKATGSMLNVCQRTDCLHTDENCDAYFGDLEIADGRIWYYNDNLYYVGWDSENDYAAYTLYSVSLDGSIRKKVCELCKIKYDSSQMADTPEVTLHRGNIYYTCRDGSTSYLYRISMNGNGSIEELCRCSGYYSGIYNMQGYGNGIVFQCFYYKNESANDSDIRQQILYYDQDTENISLLVSNNLGLCSVANDCIIYSDGKDMLSYSLKDFTSRIFVSDTAATSSFDGNYIYLDNIWACNNDITDISERKISVYNLDGTLADTIELSGNVLDSDFGDKDYLFQESMDENYNFTTWIFDKSQIGTGEHKWIELK